MSVTVGQISGEDPGSLLRPDVLLLAEVLQHAEAVHGMGGIAVIRSTFDRRAVPREALHWMNGVSAEAVDGENRIIVASHTFTGSGFETECGEQTCGRAVIDPTRSGSESLIEGTGILADFEGVGRVLGRMLLDIQGGNGNPLTSFIARTELATFGLMGHHLSEDSIVQGAARRRALIGMYAYPEYYDAALN